MLDDLKSRDIYKTLDDILVHKIFAASPKAQDFLRYIITESLEGRADNLSGVTIAQDVFQKDQSFDSIQDSVVRVTARRVRYMLQDYYVQAETRPTVLISIPKGKYKPHFEHQEIQSGPETGNNAENTVLDAPQAVRSYKKIWMAGLLSTLILVCAFWILRPNIMNPFAQQTSDISSYPSIAIIPFTNQTNNEAYGFLEQGLQKKMTEDLSRFELIRPIAYDETYETLLTDKDRKYDYAITGLMLGVEPEIDLYIKLIDLNQANTIFEDRIKHAPGQSYYYDSLFNMVSQLSGNFGGYEGVIVKNRLGDIQEKIDASTDALSDLNTFECNSLIEKLLEKPSPELYKTIYNCLETLLKDKPEDDTLLASFGWLTYVGATSHEPVLMARSVNPEINADRGFAMIEAAIAINPENAWAHQTISGLKIHKGDTKGALENAEMAVLENPANPDNLTWLGLCLAHNGNWDRAMSLAQEAIDRNPDPPSQYYYTFFLKGLFDTDPEAMAAAAETIAAKDNYYAKLYSYLAAIAVGDEALAESLKPHIDDMAKRNKGDIMPVISSRFPSKDLQEKAEHLIIKGENMLSEMYD